MPRVLMPGETDATAAVEKQEAFGMIQQAMEEIMARHNTTFLNSFRQMMVGVFGPNVDKHFEQGEPSAAANGQPPHQDISAQPPQQSMSVHQTQHVGSQSIQQNPHNAIPNPRTYGEKAFDTPGVQSIPAYRIAPTSNRLQRNMCRNGYSEFMDYSAIDALPNLGYGAATGMPAGGPGNQDTNVDLLVQRMTVVLQNQFGLKPKNQGHVYTPPFQEWYHRVALPNRVKVPTEFTKFSGQDDTSTMEYIARYLMQLGEASADEAFRIRYFPLSLIGPAFTWFTSLPAHYYTGGNEKKLIDLTTLRQRNNETPMEFLRRSRETKSMCFSLNIPNDQLAGMAVAGMLPAIQEKLFVMEFDDLGQLSHGLSLMSNQAYGFKKDSRFVKHNDIADIYNQFLERADQGSDYDDEEEIAVEEIVWGKEKLTVNQRWIKQAKGTYDFHVTKADKLFDFLVKEGRIKLPEGHSMLRPDGVKDKKYCGFHDRNSHSINECGVFRIRIQKAIQEGHLKFDNKMKLDGNPFPQNMIGFSINMVNAVEKGKVKVLTSEKAKQDGSIDPTRQVTFEQINKKEPRFLKSQIEVGESSKPRVTSRILLNKWQRQQKKERYQKHKYEEEKQRYEEEMYRKEQEEYMREQERAHWGCAFFRHCWNEGLKLPTLNNCPECSDKYTEYRQDTANRRSVHERIGRVHPSDGRRLKINEIDDQPRKRYADHRWVDHEEEEDHGYVWQKGQWCPPGLRRSQKRRVQRLRNQELKQAGIKKRQVWRPKDKPDESVRSAHTCMVCFLPNEFMAPANQIVQEEILSDVDEAEQVGLMAQLMLAKQATFDKPAKNRHMRPLYLRGYVNGKPLTKMFIDGGAVVNVMPYTTFRKLGMGLGDLTPTSIVLNDFAGNPSDTKGCVHVDSMIGSKTFLTTFFVIEGKGAYSLLLGRDWIHANCCIPSTMHQELV
jgi:hypothetical protein